MGVPEIAQDLSCADLNGKANAHARARYRARLFGTQDARNSTRGRKRARNRQDLSCARQDGKADVHAKSHAILGTSILGAQGAPEIAQEGTSKAQFNKEQLDRREAEKGEAVARWKAAVKERQATAQTASSSSSRAKTPGSRGS